MKTVRCCFFFKQKTAYEMRISDWSSDVCSSDLVDRGQRVDDEIAELGVLLQFLTRGQIDLLEIILDLLDHLDDAPQAQVAGLDVELGANIVLGAVAGARSALDRFLDRLDHDDLVDHLLAGDAVGNRQQFGAVGGNGSGHQSCPSSSISSAPSVESGTVAAINLSVRTSLAVSIASPGRLCSTSSLSNIVTQSPSERKSVVLGKT